MTDPQLIEASELAREAGLALVQSPNGRAYHIGSHKFWPNLRVICNGITKRWTEVPRDCNGFVFFVEYVKGVKDAGKQTDLPGG